jgi:hypothetical protein
MGFSRKRQSILVGPAKVCAALAPNMQFYLYRMGDVLTFVIKGDARTFVMGDGMGDAPLETRVSFTCIIGDAQ